MKNKVVRAVGIGLLVTGLSILVITGLLIIKLNKDEEHADQASKRAMDVLRLAAEHAKQTPVDIRESASMIGDGYEEGVTLDVSAIESAEADADDAQEAVTHEEEKEKEKENGRDQDTPEDPDEGSDDGGAHGREEKLMIDGTGYLGYLTFPEFRRELPVIADWDFEKLKEAPMRYEGTFEENNIVIAGHAYDVHFGFFEDEKPGNKIIFTDLSGNKLEYRIVEKEVLQPTDIEKMITGDWDMTLFTCTYSGKARLALRCVSM